MAKLIVTEFMTLDGVMEGPGGEPPHPHTGWVFDFSGPEQLKYKLDEILEADVLLVGRVTYESFAGAWPDREGPFADKMNGMPKYVVSTTLKDPAWSNTTVIDRDVGERIRELKAQEGGPILVAGSCSLVHYLTEQGLVDEYRLMVFPVLVGGGKRVFPDSPEKHVLEYAGAEVFPSGVTVQTYRTAA
jgi:dihydrofolate reductase